MFTALALSIAQLGDRPVLAVLLKSLALTVALFVVFGVGVWWGTDALLAHRAWHGTLASAAAVFVSFLAFWLLFRAVAIAAIGLFADDIVKAVEARHYPAALARARAVPLPRAIRMGLASAARFVAINAVLLPAYVLLLVTGVGAPALFFAVNAWLLGRDLGDMVAARHLPAGALADWRRGNGARRFLLGLAVTGLFVIPFVNFLAPVLGAAMATHLFHRSRP